MLACHNSLKFQGSLATDLSGLWNRPGHNFRKVFLSRVMLVSGVLGTSSTWGSAGSGEEVAGDSGNGQYRKASHCKT